MESSKKVIFIAVGIFTTLIIISIILLIINMSVNSTQEINQKITKLNENLQNDLLRYHDTVILGTDEVNIIKKHNENMHIVVEHDDETFKNGYQHEIMTENILGIGGGTSSKFF